MANNEKLDWSKRPADPEPTKSEHKDSKQDLLSDGRYWEKREGNVCYCYNGRGRLLAKIKLTSEGFYEASFFTGDLIGTFIDCNSAESAVLDVLGKA